MFISQTKKKKRILLTNINIYNTFSIKCKGIAYIKPIILKLKLKPIINSFVYIIGYLFYKS